MDKKNTWMKHITPERLGELEPLLESLGDLTELTPQLTQQQPGIFYYQGQGFLHFHEDGAEIYADLRLAGPDFERHRCTTESEQKNLLAMVSKALAG